MAYNVADCAHNKVCTACPSRIGCDMRKIFYCEDRYLKIRNGAFSRGYSAAQARGFSHSQSETFAQETIDVMDHRRAEELRLYPQYSET